MKHNQFVTIISIIGLAALLFMLFFTSPTNIGPVGVLIFFTTLYATLFGVISLALSVFYRFAFKKERLVRKDYLYSAVMSFGPIMMLMARSFGAINPWTISLIFVFLLLAEFLVYKKV